jgi:hypothetical protein
VQGFALEGNRIDMLQATDTVYVKEGALGAEGIELA